MTNTTDVSVQNKVDVKTTIRGVDVKVSNTINANAVKTSTTTELSAGKKISNAEGGAFISKKTTISASQTSTQTDIGIKVNYTIKEGNSNIIFGIKFGATVQKK